MQHVTVSGAVPADVAGRPAYHVTISPSKDGGLLGSAQLWWDAVHGVPLRLSVYATGRSDPVLELTVTQISYGPVSAGVFATPAAAHVVQVRAPAAKSAAATSHARGRRSGKARSASGVRAVQAALSFPLVAPASLQGLTRADVRLLDWGGHPAALVTYGQGLGGLAIVERPADPSGNGTGAPGSSSGQTPGHDGSPTLPGISINGSPGSELVTALGSIVQFRRAGVQYIVAGSVTGSVAEAAARAL
jgi:hypothetical protein